MKTTILIAAALLASVSFGKKNNSSPTDRLKTLRSAFPYEVRVEYTEDGHRIHWYSDGHSVTTMPRVVNSVVITNAVDTYIQDSKRIRKIAAKAAKKDSKTFQNACKDIEKARDKSSSQEFKELYQRTLDMWKAEVE